MLLAPTPMACLAPGCDGVSRPPREPEDSAADNGNGDGASVSEEGSGSQDGDNESAED